MNHYPSTPQNHTKQSVYLPGPAPLILAVDDDEAIRIVMTASLEAYGFRVKTAPNGREGVESFQRLAPDIILMDVNMPEMNGFEACSTIRSLSEGEYTPILMMTGMDDVESIDHAFDVGATDFINKPINWVVLNYRLKYMLRASTAFNHVVRQQTQIQQLAYYDHLTGLTNRIMFKKELVAEVKKCRNDNKMLAVLFMDLDRFKLVNDSLGHQAGDELLRQVAQRIKGSIRSTDGFGRVKEPAQQVTISRQGGDEFTLILPELNSPENAGQVARRINERLSNVFFIDGYEVFITISIGISLFPMDGANAESLMKRADLSMYQAKENGGNCFQYFKQGLNSQATERFKFENDVRKAVMGEKFSLFYQPQVSMADGLIIGGEALTRWHNNHKGYVSPAEFIPVIEEIGLVIPFTDWVIKEAGQQQLQWYEQGIDPVKIAVNISSKNFVTQEIPGKIIKILNSLNLPPSCLEVELTESVMATSSRETISILNKLKEIGLNISVDDFGTGYSSLSYLKNLPIDVVKIDRFFVKDILSGQKGESIVRGIIFMAHSMNMKVIAEGIETQEQFELLRRMGCDYGQGFLFSPAVSRDEFSVMLKEKRCFLS